LIFHFFTSPKLLIGVSCASKAAVITTILVPRLTAMFTMGL
jgi:hypothetical protein